MGRVPETALTFTNPAVLAGWEARSVRGDRGCLARIPAILQIREARAWETLPGIFHRLEKQEKGAKSFLKLKRRSLKALLPKGKLEPQACAQVHLGSPCPRAPVLARRPARPTATQHARVESRSLRGTRLHLPPGRCHFPSLVRATEFLERRGRVGTWKAGSGGDARTFPAPWGPRTDFFLTRDGKVTRVPESVCGPAWAAGAAHWLARPAGASPRPPPRSITNHPGAGGKALAGGREEAAARIASA